MYQNRSLGGGGETVILVPVHLFIKINKYFLNVTILSLRISLISLLKILKHHLTKTNKNDFIFRIHLKGVVRLICIYFPSILSKIEVQVNIQRSHKG